MCYIGTDEENFTGSFMAKDVVVFNNAGPDCASFPEMQVGPGSRTL
jgi:hypothetical protein